MSRDTIGTRWKATWWFQMWLLIAMVWVVMLTTYAASNFPFAAGEAEFKAARSALGPVDDGALAGSADPDASAVKGSMGITYKFRQDTDPERMKAIARRLDADIEQALGAKRKAFASRFFWMIVSVPVVGFALFFLIGVKRGEV